MAFPLLFSPLQLGPLKLRNRIAMSAMTTGFGFDEGVPDEAICAYLEERSGGVAMTTVAFGAVSPEGRVEEKLPWMWRPDAARAVAPLAEAIHEGGAYASLQLGHGGRQVSPKVTGQEPVAPSAVAPLAHVKQPPRALRLDEIERIILAFGRAAGEAEGAGFDAVEIHAGHGYLFHQFLSAEANRRDDRYGGATVAERARFLVDVIGAVRAETREIAILVRLNGDDLVAGGSGPQEAADAASAAAAAGAHAVIVSAGVYGSVPYTIPMLDDEEGAHIELAAYVREHVSVPVLSVGGIDRPSIAEAAIARGACDAVVVGRALIADPEWVEKASLGDVGSIRPCIGLVDSCAGVLEHGSPIGCAVNPEVGREGRRRPTEATFLRRVVVVGAGPAGMEAAGCAAELGHDVVLLERRHALGGMLALAATTPPLLRLARLVAWYSRRLAMSGVRILTGVDADGEAVAALEPDAVVLAIGSRSAVPVIDGFDQLPAWTIEDYLDGGASTCGAVPVPARLVVLGATRAAMAVALQGARHGADVTLLDRERLGWDASGLVRRAYKTRLAREGIGSLRGRPVRLRTGAVVWEDDDHLRSDTKADGVVIADHRVPSTFAGLDRLGGVPVTVIGDAHEPRDCGAAVADGRQAAEAIGR